MSTWHCSRCGTTLTWIYDVKPGCPSCRATNRSGDMRRVTDEAG